MSAPRPTRLTATVLLIEREFFMRLADGYTQLITFQDQWNNDVQAGKLVYVAWRDGVLRVTERVSENKKFTQIPNAR